MVKNDNIEVKFKRLSSNVLYIIISSVRQVTTVQLLVIYIVSIFILLVPEHIFRLTIQQFAEHCDR